MPQSGIDGQAGIVLSGPMSDVVHGSDGIPRDGHAEAYATQLWLDDPIAFWLHPEGPLSDKTPDEWRAEQAEIAKARQDWNYRQSAQSTAYMMASLQLQQMQFQNQYALYQNQLSRQQGLSSLWGLRFP